MDDLDALYLDTLAEAVALESDGPGVNADRLGQYPAGELYAGRTDFWSLEKELKEVPKEFRDTLRSKVATKLEETPRPERDFNKRSAEAFGRGVETTRENLGQFFLDSVVDAGVSSGVTKDGRRLTDEEARQAIGEDVVPAEKLRFARDIQRMRRGSDPIKTKIEENSTWTEWLSAKGQDALTMAIEATPQIVASMVAARAGGGLAGLSGSGAVGINAASRGGSIAGYIATTASSVEQDYREEGLSPGLSQSLSKYTAALLAPLEMIAEKMIPGASKAASATVVKAVKKNALEFGKDWAEEAGTELLEQIGQDVVGAVANYVENEKAPDVERMYVNAVEALKGGAMAAGPLLAPGRAARTFADIRSAGTQPGTQQPGMDQAVDPGVPSGPVPVPVAPTAPTGAAQAVGIPAGQPAPSPQQQAPPQPAAPQPAVQPAEDGEATLDPSTLFQPANAQQFAERFPEIAARLADKVPSRKEMAAAVAEAMPDVAAGIAGLPKVPKTFNAWALNKVAENLPKIGLNGTSRADFSQALNNFMSAPPAGDQQGFSLGEEEGAASGTLDWRPPPEPEATAEFNDPDLQAADPEKTLTKPQKILEPTLKKPAAAEQPPGEKTLPGQEPPEVARQRRIDEEAAKQAEQPWGGSFVDSRDNMKIKMAVPTDGTPRAKTTEEKAAEFGYGDVSGAPADVKFAMAKQAVDKLAKDATEAPPEPTSKVDFDLWNAPGDGSSQDLRITAADLGIVRAQTLNERVLRNTVKQYTKPGVRESQINRVFPGSKVEQTADKTWKVTLPSGATVDVREEPELVMPDSASVKASTEEGYDVKLTDEQYEKIRLAGTYSFKVGDFETNALGLIQLSAAHSKEYNDDIIPLRHEALHLARNAGLFTESEWESLVKKYSKPERSELRQQEDIAKNVEAWTDPKGVLDKLRKWISELLSAFGLRGIDPDAVIREFGTAEFWDRSPEPIATTSAQPAETVASRQAKREGRLADAQAQAAAQRVAANAAQATKPPAKKFEVKREPRPDEDPPFRKSRVRTKWRDTNEGKPRPPAKTSAAGEISYPSVESDPVEGFVPTQLPAAEMEAAAEPAPAQSGRPSLEDFTNDVADVARAAPAASKFGPNKVYLSEVRKALPYEMSKADFADMMFEAMREGKLQLSRADLVAAMDRKMVDASEIKDGFSAYHFVRSDELPAPRAAKKPPNRRTAQPGVAAGDTTTIDAVGFDKPIKARYEVRELSALIPSHNYMSGQPSPNVERGTYPEGLQPRDYKLGNSEDVKVRDFAQQKKDRYYLSDHPAADSGPPTVTKGNVVLNGNGRAMSLQYAASQLDMDWYRNALMKKAAQFGIDPAAIEGMDAPVLVRVVDMDPTGEDAKRFARAGNVSTTQEQSPEREAASLAGMIDQDVLDSLALDLEGDNTFADAVTDPSKGRRFRERLRKAIPTGRVNRYFQEDGMLTDDGKEFVRNMMLASVLPVKTIEKMSENMKAVRNAVEAAVPQLIAFDRAYPANNPTAQLVDALEFLARNPSIKTDKDIADTLAQKSLFGGRVEKLTPAARMMAEFVVANGRSAKKFRDAIKKAMAGLSPTKGMFADLTVEPSEVIADAIGVPLRKGAEFGPMASEPGGEFFAKIDADGLGEVEGDFFASIPGAKKADKAVRTAGRLIRGRGDLPANAFEFNLEKDQALAAMQYKMVGAVSRYKRAARKTYGWRGPGENVRRRVNAVLAGKQPSAVLPTTIRGEVEAMRRMISQLSKRLIDEGVVQGELAVTVQNNLDTYLNRSYEIFDNPNWPDKIKKNKGVVNRAIAWLRSENPNLTDAELNRLLDSFLDAGREAGAPVALFGSEKFASINEQILKKRKNLPKPLRDLMGEYKDPLVNFTRSVTKIAQMVEQTRLVDQIMAEGRGKYLFDQAWQKDGHFAPIDLGGLKTLPQRQEFYTTPEIATAFNDAFTRKDVGWWTQQYMKLNAMVKSGKTVYSPMSTFRNFWSNVLFAIAQGHINPVKGFEAAKTIGAYIAGKESWEDRISRYIELGVLGSDVKSGELRDTMRDAFREGTVPGNFATEMFKKMQGAAQTTYEVGDAFWKVNAFETEKSAYERAGLPPALAELEAAKITQNTYPTYSRVPEAVKMIRRAPFVGSFVSFPAEVIRTTKNTVLQIKSELSNPNPNIKWIGVRRLGGAFAATLIPFGAALASKMFWGVTDDEEEALLEFAAPWTKNSNLVYTGRGENGVPTYIDTSYSDPHSYLREPLMAMLRGEDFTEKSVNAGWALLEPFFGEEMLAGALMDLRSNVNPRRGGSPIYAENEPLPEIAGDIAKFLAPTLEPGFVTQGRRVKKGIDGEVDYQGKPYEPLREMRNIVTGQREETVEPRQGLYFKGVQYRDVLAEATRHISDRLDKEGKVSDEEIADAYKTAEAMRRGAFDDIRKAIEAASVLGMSDEEIAEKLKLGKAETEALMAGTYRPYKPSTTSLPKASDERKALINRLAREEAERLGGAALDYTDAQFRQEIVMYASRIAGPVPKDEAKRAEYEANVEKSLKWLDDNGVDREEVQRLFAESVREKFKEKETRGRYNQRLKGKLFPKSDQ